MGGHGQGQPALALLSEMLGVKLEPTIICDSISISEYPLQSSNLGLYGFNRNLFQFAVFRFLLYPIFSGRRWHAHGVKCLISGNDDARLTRAGMSEGMRYPIQ